MERKRCFFMGHRDAPAEIASLIGETVEEHITCLGVTEFLVGDYGSFDRMAARAVLHAKEKHGSVSLVRLLPYHPGEKKVILPEGFDGSLYPAGQERVPRRLAIVRANRYALEHSACLIAYAWQPGSNARKLLEYAGILADKGMLEVINLAEMDRQNK